MPILPSDPYYNQHVLIDLEVVKLQARIMQLYLEKNALLPVCRLPPEILCRIFLWTRDSPHGGFNFSPKSWTPITQVCHHWRDIALSSPELWSNIDTKMVRQASCFLSRSKKAPIQVIFGRQMQLVPEIISQHQRLRSLRIPDCPPACSQLIKGLCSVFLPNLQILDLTFPNPDKNATRDDQTLPFDFLACGAPQLRAITLNNRTVHWESPFFSKLPALQELDLCFCPNSTDSKKPRPFYLPNPADDFFLDALSNMSALTTLGLTIDATNNNFALGSNRHNQSIIFRNLELLHVEMYLDSCITLVKALALPPSARMILGTGLTTTQAGLGTEIAHAIMSAWLSDPLQLYDGSSGQLPICALRIGLENEYGRRRIGFEAWLEDQSFPLDEVCNTSQLTISLRHSNSFSEFLTAFPLHSLYSLDADIPFEGHIWDTFANLPNLKCISLRKGGALSFIKYFCHSDPDLLSFINNHPKTTTPSTQRTVSSLADRQGTSTPIKYPKLITLKLSDVTFDPNTDEDGFDAKAERMNRTTFRRFLQWRQKLGLPIQTLCISHCRYLGDDVDKTLLSQLVVNLEWDSY